MSNATTLLNPLATDPSSKGNLWVAVCIPTLVLTSFVVGVRVWWRRKQTGRIGSSDIAILFSLLCATLQLILGCIGILRWGLGHHAAYVGLHHAQMAMMYFYLYQIFYKILVCTTKISFILLYVELFPVPKFRMICHIFNGLTVAAGIAFTTATIFQCTPIPYAWNKTIAGGTCTETATFWYSHAVWNTAFDVMILCLPMPVIRSLQMGKKQKIAVAGVFGLGAFVIIASIIRMVSLDPASKTSQADMTYVISTSNALLWTQVESTTAILCVCLPTLKGPLVRILPKIFSTGNTNYSRSYAMEDISTKDSRNITYAKGSGSGKDDGTSSQEEIFGITKTVDVEVSSMDAANWHKKDAFK